MSTAALSLAFSAGLLASVNPCGFAMLPSMVSFYLGQGEEDYAARSLWRRAGEGLALGALVTAGFLLVFVLAGGVGSGGGGGGAPPLPPRPPGPRALSAVPPFWVSLPPRPSVRAAP